MSRLARRTAVRHSLRLAGLGFGVIELIGLPAMARGQSAATLPRAVEGGAPSVTASDVVRGTVTTDSGAALIGADVVVTVSWTTRSVHTVTDAAGRYVAVLVPGSGDYIVAATSPGRRMARRRVTRTGRDSVLTVDLVLLPSVAQLAQVQIRAVRRQKPAAQQTTDPDLGGLEQAPSDFASTPDARSELATFAASAPGVVLVPGTDAAPSGFSILGMAPTQNGVTLNGLSFAGGMLPAPALGTTRLRTSVYDPTVGGFSAGLLSTVVSPGSNLVFGSAGVTVDAPSLQWTDRAGADLGQRLARTQVTAARSGPLVRDKLFYNVGVQAGRQSRPVPSLVSADARVLDRVGLSDLTRANVLRTLDRLGVPFAHAAETTGPTRSNAALVARFDMLPRATRVLDVLVSGGWQRSEPLQLGPTSAFADAGARTTWNTGIQGELATHVRDFYLFRVRSGLSLSGTEAVDRSTLPTGRVLVQSSLPAGDDRLQSVQFGSASMARGRSRAWSWETNADASWYTGQNRHRLKVGAGTAVQGASSHRLSDPFGAFTFQSTDDLAAGRAASYTRTLGGTAWQAVVPSLWVGAGDQWTVTDRLSVQYGARIEGTGAATRPASNVRLERVFGVRTDAAAVDVQVSPRVGFTWAYGATPHVGIYRTPRARVQGGIGAFREALAPGTVGAAVANNGLPDGLSRLTCLGPAAPLPDWDLYRQDAATIPTQCATSPSAGAFADARPSATVFMPGYVPSRSWRANLGWMGEFVGRTRLAIDAVYSLGTRQQSAIDLNFAGATGFGLADEANRPVFVDAERIDPTSGGVGIGGSRISSDFSRVTGLASDMGSRSGQLLVSLAPNGGFAMNRTWSLAYAYGMARDRTRGFDGATDGDPRRAAWGSAALDVRHSVVGSYSMPVGAEGSFSLGANVHSGLPFTPGVQGDVNGDGLANDRAFVFDPLRTGDADVAGGMSQLLRDAPPAVRACLSEQVGRIAGRNSCRGPWSVTTWARLGISGYRVGLGDRSRVSLVLSNLAGGLDLVLHGSDHVRGWGQQALIDPTLLVVRGFDAGARAYRYSVNPGFGDSRPARTATRLPFQLTLSASVPVGAAIARQQLDGLMGPGRFRGGPRLTVAQTRQRLGSSFFDPIPALLEARDSLLLTTQQVAALGEVGKRYTAATTATWTRLATFLAGQDSAYRDVTVRTSMRDAKREALTALSLAAREVRALLTPEQASLLGPDIRMMLDEETIARRAQAELRAY